MSIPIFSQNHGDYGGCRCRSAVKWHDLQQKDFDMHFLMGLNESYAALKTHLMSLDHFLSFGNVFSLVLLEDRQRSAFVLNGDNRYSSPPLSESIGMFTNTSQSGYNKPRARLYCTHRGKTNYTIDKYFKLHGFSPLPVLLEVGILLFLVEEGEGLLRTLVMVQLPDLYTMLLVTM